MKKSKFSESQIVNILKEAKTGATLKELIRQHGFSKATFYKWKGKYSSMLVSKNEALKGLSSRQFVIQQNA
jgi:putative transposase